MMRVPALDDPAKHLAWTLGALLGMVLFAGSWLGVVFSRWTRHVNRLEMALASQPVEQVPPLEMTGEIELDRIITALNEFVLRLQRAREESARLAGELARAERLSALGRMAAGLAHEIRNPIAAMRLKAENALAKTAGDQEKALRSVLVQIERLDRLLRALLDCRLFPIIRIGSSASRHWTAWAPASSARCCRWSWPISREVRADST